MVEAGTPFRTEQLMPSGLIMTLEVRPLLGGGWVTVCDDITGRAKLESALQLQTERIEHAVRHMSHGLTMFGADERVIVCNEQYARVYGLDPDVIKPGITHREVIVHWVSRGHSPGLSAEEIYNRRMREIRRAEASVGYLTRRDGRVIQAISSPMPGGGWVSTCEDVSERLRYEDELKQQNFLLDAALENMAHGLCVYDGDMRLRVCNDRYLKIYGLAPHEAEPGTHLADLIRRTIKKAPTPANMMPSSSWRQRASGSSTTTTACCSAACRTEA